MANFFDKYIKNNIFWFLLLFPLALLLFFKDLILSFIVETAHRQLDKAKNRDKKLSDDVEKLKMEADAAQKKADELEQAVKMIENDENWHEKRKK